MNAPARLGGATGARADRQLQLSTVPISYLAVRNNLVALEARLRFEHGLADVAELLAEAQRKLLEIEKGAE